VCAVPVPVRNRRPFVDFASMTHSVCGGVPVDVFGFNVSLSHHHYHHHRRRNG
jgi:hypothetical protein